LVRSCEARLYTLVLNEMQQFLVHNSIFLLSNLMYISHLFGAQTAQSNFKREKA